MPMLTSSRGRDVHANGEARPCSHPKSANNAHANVQARPCLRPKSASNAHATVEARARKGRTLRPVVQSECPCLCQFSHLAKVARGPRTLLRLT